MSTSDFKATLKQLKTIKGEPAVSVFVPTHRTFPDNEQDPIVLKNQLKVVEERVTESYDKRTAQAVLDQILVKTNELDHNYNLDTLAIFATPNSAEVMRLPFDTAERVVVDTKFATRDFMRHLSQSYHYYILVITSEMARLIEAVDNRVIKEVKGGSERQQSMSELTFPVNNTTLPTGSKADRTGSSDDDKYLKEFFNRVDKSLQELYNKTPLPVILVGDDRNVGKYNTIVDRPDMIVASVSHLSADLDDDAPTVFVEGVQEIVGEQRQTRFDSAKGDLEKARNEKMVRNDLQQIYRSAFEGNAVTLLVRQGYSVPAMIDEAKQTLQVTDDATQAGVTDDAVAEVIELASHNGANVVFMPVDMMDEKEPIALITRY
ncbi:MULTISPECIES: hypothetical protein [unclassified Moraxella]|uniref:AOC03_06830 family ribosome hibernation factor n=1 Tax=unclassified Moraxella TaxID=2685852 RepID=UPI003AF92D68